MVICLIDGKEFKNGGVMARHLIETYNITFKEYYHENILKTSEIPKCKCGCGGEVRWNGMKYCDFVKGHHIRVHNPWGHNPKAILKSAETRRRQYASGERKPWNVGLNSGNDIRVKIGAQNSKDAINNNPKEIQRRRESMKRNRVTLRGKDHPMWKGGTSPIQAMARSDKRLYHEWKFPILKAGNFTCSECPSKKDIQVHHDKETFSEIIKKVMTIDDYERLEEFEVKQNVVHKITQYHIDNKVSGVVLCRECHGKLHPSLNFLVD